MCRLARSLVQIHVPFGRPSFFSKIGDHCFTIPKSFLTAIDDHGILHSCVLLGEIPSLCNLEIILLQTFSCRSLCFLKNKQKVKIHDGKEHCKINKIDNFEVSKKEMSSFRCNSVVFLERANGGN